MRFDELQLADQVMSGIRSSKFEECTPVQSAVIQPALKGKDVSGLAQTGTGKTAAFLVPTLERIWRSKEVQKGNPDFENRAYPEWKDGQFCLILVPTRELAEQVYEDVYRLRGETGVEAVAIYGGTSYDEQKSKIAKGVEFVISTPGRLIDLYKNHVIDLKQVRCCIFDEADRMFDMGFKDDMIFLLNRIPKDRQILLFSATLNFDVLTTVYKFGADPVEFNLSKDEVKAENVHDQIMHVSVDEKPRMLLSLLKKENAKQIIIFSNFKNNISRITQLLNDNGFHAVGISSLLTQSQRNRVLEQFKDESETNIMVATDVAARGLDIKGVDLVINYDLPDDSENYIHRIGRTGRAGKTGSAYSMVGERDVEALMRLEEYLKNKLKVFWLEDADILLEFNPMKSEFEGKRKPQGSPSGDRNRRPQGGGRSNDNRGRDRNRDGNRDGNRSAEGRSGGGESRPDRGHHRNRPHAGGPKPEGQGPRQTNPNQNRQNANGPRPHQPSQKSGEGNVHRDRRSGRHQSQEGENREPRNPNAQAPNAKPAQGAAPAGSGKKRNRSRNRVRRRGGPGQRGPNPSQPQTVGQKIKSIFKKLFS